RMRQPWTMALVEDRLWAALVDGGTPSRGQRLFAAATKRGLNAVFSDVDAYVRFMRVAHMLDSPMQLLSPGFASAVLLGGLRGRGRVVEAPGVTLEDYEAGCSSA
ncbi:MAG: hypothetical protein KC457_24115, partial [Myxococcales bacterium]|nr:hypothetical protein [Myxococcales bacterium]